MKMLRKTADLILIAIFTLWIHTTQSSRQSPKCPIGFDLAYTKSKGEAVCYRLKGPEAFADKFKDCAGNRYTFKLYNELAIKNPSFLKLWVEYKSAYPGGPFVDWSYTESAGDLLVRSYDFNVAYDPVKGLDEECLLIEDVLNARSNLNITSARCDEQYYRFCMVEPYSDRQYSCEQFEDSWRFWTPRTTCLARVTGLGGGAVRATWKQAKELCAKRGASLLHRGWIYANNMVFQPTRNTDIPLGAVVSVEGYSIVWSDTEDGSNHIPVDELNSLGVRYSSAQDQTLALRFNDEDDVEGATVTNSTLFYDVVCERSIHLRNVDMTVDVYSDRRIKLLINDSVDDNEISCFTDSAAYYPTSVEIKRENDSVYDLKPARNGYYWCIHYDSTNYRVAESNKALFVRKDRSLQNLFAIKIRTIDNYDLKDLDKNYKFWERSLREYILCRTRFYELNGHDNISDEEFRQEYNLEVFKKKRPELHWRVNVIESMRLKRVLRDTKTVLLHVDISPEMRQAPPGKWGDLEVLYMKPAYYCPETDFSSFAELGQSVTAGCFTFTCVGDFNEGVQWVETAVEGCTTRPSQWVDTAISFRNPSPPSMNKPEKAQRTSIRQENSSSDSSEELTTSTAANATTTTTDSNFTQISETVSTVSPTTDEMTTESKKPPRPPHTTTTQVPTTMPPPDEQLRQVLEDLENLLQNDTVPVQVEDIDDAFDRVDILLEVEEDLEIPGDLLHLLDQLGAKVDLNGSQSASTVRGNIAMLMADASPEAPVRGLRIATRDSELFTNNAFEIISDVVNSSHLTTDLNEAVVQLPQSVSESTRRISFVVFRTDRAFHSGQGHYSVNSRVLSINVENITHFEQGEVIDIHLTPMLEIPERNASRACAYWHFFENGTGYWSQEGCTFIRSKGQDIMDTCRCDHLTHFAEILVPRSVFSQTNEDVLEILSIVGCFISIFGLLFIGLTALLFRSWRRDFSNKIWLQLCFAIFALALCFLIIAFVKFTEYDVFCMLLGVALHYSVLASFCWMLVAAILSYRRLVLVFARDASHKLLRASAFSWGAPCAVVGILLSVSPHSYAGRFEEKMPAGSFCYPSGLGLWLSVYMPVAVMLIANWTLFILIVRSVFASKRIQRHGDTNEAFRCASVSCLLVFLFGLPWIFGLFAYNIVAAYLFTITVTFQGFVLFLFFVLCNKKTRDLWLNKLKIKRTQRIPVTSSTYTNKSTGSGWRSATNTSKPRSLASPDDSRFT